MSYYAIAPPKACIRIRGWVRFGNNNILSSRVFSGATSPEVEMTQPANVPRVPDSAAAEGPRASPVLVTSLAEDGETAPDPTVSSVGKNEI